MARVYTTSAAIACTAALWQCGLVPEWRIDRPAQSVRACAETPGGELEIKEMS
jgi:hypothetical protein